MVIVQPLVWVSQLGVQGVDSPLFVGSSPRSFEAVQLLHYSDASRVDAVGGA